MKRLGLIYIILTFFALVANSQSIEQIKADTKNYLWGESSGTTLTQADQMALQNLISQISTTVQSEFNWVYGSDQKGQNLKDSTKINIIVKTYSNATLHNTERIVVSNEPDAFVFRYIKRTEIHKVFEQRRNKIIQFVTDAQRAESEARVSDALRYYYWALILLRSHPDGNEIKYISPTSRENLLITWIPAQINAVFAEIQLKQTGVQKEGDISTLILNVEYKGKPATNFDYSYWDGRDWSAIIAAKDGRGFIELAAASVDNLQELKIKIEYTFESEARMDKELETVIQNTETVAFKNSYLLVKLQNSTEVPFAGNQNTNGSQTSNTAKNLYHSKIEFTPLSDDKLYKEKLAKVVQAIRQKQYVSIKNLFTAAGFEMFEKLITYGNCSIISEPQILSFRLGDRVICRSVPMKFSFANNTRKFLEDVVFYFNKEGLIESLSFGLNKNAFSSIAGNTKWSETDRMHIIDFLEHFKTAYALKRLDYIESVFADNALIIIGNVLKVANKNEFRFKDNKIIKFNKINKSQYMTNLKLCFASNEFINVNFEESIIRKSGAGENVYGIQIKQNYFSSNYGDEGYLFLMVDLNNPKEPTIHVRTWQPEKNPDGSIYGLGDF